MAQAEKQIVAAQKFLLNVTALPTFDDLRGKQVTRLTSLLSKNLLSIEQSASLMSILDSNVWGSDIMEQLKTCIAQQTCHDDGDCAAASRASLQDFTNIPHYLSQDWWNLLESGKDKVRNLESLCGLAASLGLRNASEPTYAGLCALAFCLGSTKLLEVDKLKLLGLHKPRMKKVFSNAVPLVSVMDALPSSPQDCQKEFLDTAYPNGFVAGTPVTLTMDNICRLVDTYPCRRRGKVTGESSIRDVESPVTKTLSRFAAVAKAFTDVHSGTREKEALPGLKLLRPEATAIPESSKPFMPQQLALMDRQQGASAEAAPKAEEAEEPSATVQKLKEALETEKGSKSHPKKGKKDLLLKGDANKKGKTFDLPESQETSVKKRPAGKLVVYRKPAVSSHGMKRPAASQNERDAKRQQVLKLVPAELLSRYKGGCSRCYHREYCTVSCWARRGYTLVEDLNLKTIMALEMCLRSGMWETFVSSIWDVRN